MGRGNALIRDREGFAHETFYINHYEHSDEINEYTGEPYCSNDPCYCNETFYEDLIGNIQCTYKAYNTNCDIHENRYYKGHDSFISIISTPTFELILHDDDDESRVAIGCIPIYTERETYNKYIFKRAANKAMSIVKSIYTDMRVRTGPWTSGEIYNNQFYYYGT